MKIYVIISAIVMALLLSSTIYFASGYYDSRNKITNIREITKFSTESESIYIEAEEYYRLASLSYEQRDWKELVSNCELARTRYSNYAQELRNNKAKIVDRTEKILVTYSQILQKKIDLSMNLYEACEHFESASRYYETYYLESTPQDDPSYEMGNKEIENMNDKIKEHDNNVEDYNTLLSQYSLLMEEYLK